MNKTLFISLLAALPVLAQQDMPKTKDIPTPPPGMEQPRHWGAAGEMPGRQGREDFHKKMLEKFDADKDGRLSDAEKEAMKADMQKRRAEGENRPGAKRPEGMQHPSREDMHKKMLEKFDADKDGRLSDAEKEAMKADMQKRRAEGENRPGAKRPEGMQHPSREDMHKKMLEKFDADKDGCLSDAEKEAMKAARPQRGGKDQGRGRGPKDPRGNKRGEATQGADVPATLPL